MGQSDRQSPRLCTSYCVTLVGATPAVSENLEDAFRSIGGSLTFEIRCKPAAGDISYPMEAVHAIIFTPTNLTQATLADVDTLRSVTKLGTCRVYLLISPGSSPPPDTSPLDDFLQRTPTRGADAIAQQIIEFFREADDLNRRSTLLALRDRTCLGAYTLLRVLWPSSYIFAVLHILNATAIFAGREPWPGVLVNPYVVPAATFFGVSFIVHCIHAVVRNTLFGVRIVKRFNRGFALSAGALGLAVVATARSIVTVDHSAFRILTSVVLAMATYSFYMYARRTRAECSSLSQLQAAMADSRRRGEVLGAVGRQPFTPNAFPFLPFRAKTLFISYMHGSEWSTGTAVSIHRWASDHGFEVFLDRSTIPSGSVWRKYLLQAISECVCFIAVLDGQAAPTEWVLAESAYATLLRKSIGKPRLLLVARTNEGLVRLQQGPFGVIYMDMFQLPPERCPGAAILIADDDKLTAELILRSIEELRPMCLLR